MSTTEPRSSYDCAYSDCQNTFPANQAVAGSYCSEDCKHAHQGWKLLNTIQSDHKFCSNCGSQLKEVEKPPKTFLVGKTRAAANSIVGFQYRTPDAATGEIDVDDTPGREQVSTGTICGQCGNTNQQEVFPEDHHRHLVEYGHRFLEAIKEQRREGVHDKQVEESVFFDTLVRSDDLALALGEAIE